MDKLIFDLFGNSQHNNLLPFDGTVQYYGKIMSLTQSDYYQEALLNHIEWKHDEAVIFGKHFITKRKVAWYGNKHFTYTYSNITKEALLWTDDLIKLKTLVEAITRVAYNSCLLNLYHDGTEGMAYHSDDEKTLGSHTNIASLSFGATRKFLFKHKVNKHTVSTILEHGSLLVMKDDTQKHWLHRLPTTTKVKSPRINLTFRQMLQ